MFKYKQKLNIKMPKVMFKTAGTVTNIIGFVNEHEGDIKIKMLQNLQNKSIGM